VPLQVYSVILDSQHTVNAAPVIDANLLFHVIIKAVKNSKVPSLTLRMTEKKSREITRPGSSFLGVRLIR